MSVLILGLGNLIMTDDGVGGHVARRLSEVYQFSEGVEVVDGGTLGLDLLPRLEGIDRLVIVDALEMGEAPGTVFRLTGEEVPRAFASKLSVHQMGVQDLLAVAELQGNLPGELVVWGVQPASIEVGTCLTETVSGVLDRLVEGVVEELARWGVAPSRKGAAA